MGFTPHEALSLSKVWVEQSAVGCNQREDCMWSGKHLIFTETYPMNSSAEALWSKWGKLSLCFQHFISARELVRIKFPSGRTLEKAGDLVLNIYGKKSVARVNGVFRPAADFTYQEAPSFLSSQPKWEE